MTKQSTVFSRCTLLAAVALATTSAMAGLTGEFLFIGVDDSAVPSYLVDPDNMSSMTPVNLGVQVWGAAGNDLNQVLYVSEGSVLSLWNYGTWTEIGTGTTIRSPIDGAVLVMEGLAVMNGALYGSYVGNTALHPEGIYLINPDTAVATLVHAYPVGTGQTNSGFDAGNGLFYATNDALTNRGLVSYDPNNAYAVTHEATYPAGETDIDGLAIGGGAAWLIEDDGAATGMLYRWDFAAQSYTSVATPWVTNETFSGAAYINIVPEPGTFAAMGVGLAGLLAIRRRK